MADPNRRRSELGADNDANSARPICDADFKTVITTQHKNVEAIVQVSRLALDGVQRAWRIQFDFVWNAVEEFSALARDLGEPTGSLSKHLARQTAYSRIVLKGSLSNTRELTELTIKATNEAMSLVSQRFGKSLEEARRAYEMRGD
jgi:phasin family protein